MAIEKHILRGEFDGGDYFHLILIRCKIKLDYLENFQKFSFFKILVGGAPKTQEEKITQYESFMSFISPEDVSIYTKIREKLSPEAQEKSVKEHIADFDTLEFEGVTYDMDADNMRSLLNKTG